MKNMRILQVVHNFPPYSYGGVQVHAKALSEELAKKHKCSKSSIERQYYKIMKDLAELQKEQREELRVQMIMRTNHLYQRALETGNIKNAIDAVNLQSKIGGLYQPEKAEKEEKPQAPKFVFQERKLSVVPKDDDDERDASNE